MESRELEHIQIKAFIHLPFTMFQSPSPSKTFWNTLAFGGIKVWAWLEDAVDLDRSTLKHCHLWRPTKVTAYLQIVIRNGLLNAWHLTTIVLLLLEAIPTASPTIDCDEKVSSSSFHAFADEDNFEVSIMNVDVFQTDYAVHSDGAPHVDSLQGVMIISAPMRRMGFNILLLVPIKD